VNALAVVGRDLYVGGNFQSGAPSIAKWDGSNWTALGSGPEGPVEALAVSGGDLYAAGDFLNAGLSGAHYIAKWDGSKWSALGSGLGLNERPVALLVSGGVLYAGGVFWRADGNTVNSIAKWDGRSWTALGSGMNGFVGALAVSGNDLYAGGGFTTAGGKVSAYTARAYLPTLPVLSVFRSASDFTVSWPSANTADFALERAGTLVGQASWMTNSGFMTDDGNTKTVTVLETNSQQFFRLRRQ
jgi:hypothetical protein